VIALQDKWLPNNETAIKIYRFMNYNKVGKVSSIEHTKAPKAFFTSHPIGVIRTQNVTMGDGLIRLAENSVPTAKKTQCDSITRTFSRIDIGLTLSRKNC
jgi:hypothetical protein